MTKQIILTVSLLLTLASVAFGQTERRVEVSAAYSHLNTSEQSVNLFPVGSIRLKPTSQNGYEVSVTGNVNPTIGITFNHSGHFGHQESVLDPIGLLPTSLISNLRTYHYEAGPRLTIYNDGSKRAYVMVLFGDVNRNGADAFAFSVGGGLDHKLTDNFSIRLFEARYGFNRLAHSARAQNQKTFTLSTGFVFGK